MSGPPGESALDASLPADAGAGEPGGLRPVHGSASLVLSEADRCFRVESGALTVFGTRFEGGACSGARQYLFTCSAGDVLFGTCGEGWSLICQGVVDSEVRELSLAQLDGDRSPGWWAAIRNWVNHTPEVLRHHLGHSPGDLFPTGTWELEPGQVARPAEPGLVWARVLRGRAGLGPAGAIDWSPGEGWLPVTDQCRLQALEPAQFEFAPAEALSQPGELQAGLDRLHRLWFRGLAARQREQDEQEARRLRQSHEQVALATAEAAAEFQGLMGEPPLPHRRETPLLSALGALEPLLGVRFELPPQETNLSEAEITVDVLAARAQVRIRRVLLPEGWWRRDGGPLLGFLGDDRRPVALYRTERWLGLFGHYLLFDPVDQAVTTVTATVAASLAPEAVSFIRPFPVRQSSSLFALVRFLSQRIWREGLLLIALSSLTALLGMLQPMATQLLVDKAIPEADVALLYQMAFGLVVMSCGATAFSLSQGLVAIRFSTLASTGLQSALFDRLLRLPQSFFRRFSTGDLTNRAMMVHEIGTQINGATLSVVLSGVLSLLNLRLCFQYAPQLAWIAVAVAGASALVAGLFSIPIRRRALAMERLSGAHDGLSLQLIAGISKLRVSGAEQRAFNHWSRQYAGQLRLGDELQELGHWSSLLTMIIDLAGLIVVFYFASRGLTEAPSLGVVTARVTLTMGTFLGFYGAFKSVVSGVTSVTDRLTDLVDGWSRQELIAPLLEARPESGATSIHPGQLGGRITLDQVVFRYRPDAPFVLNGLSLEVLPGEFAAIVGVSGCGKSTVFRLLLGFESPESGRVYFDGQDLATLDKTEVRRQMGTVIQAGRINAGTIFEAIAGGAQITLEQAWEAIRDAGLEEDLRALPMGLHTVLSEGATTFSGGQRQRLLIARALVRNPKILLFDEATSALDNRTQQLVNLSLRRRRVTRLVIAHRLSTIREADRIFVLEGGTVRQAGRYEELMSQEGLFRRLAARQLN